MRLSAILLLVAAFALAGATDASAETITSTYGAITASLTYMPDSTTGFNRLGRLVVTRGGLPAYDAGVEAGDCGTFCFLGADPTSSGALSTLNLDSDIEPEILTSVYTGGAHCCTYAYVLDFVAASGTYRPLTQAFGDAGFRLADPEVDSIWEFETADSRFAYRFTAYAYSGLPLQYLRFDGSGFVDVSRSYRRQLARDARGWRSLIGKHIRRGRLRRGSDVRGFYAAWAADQFRLDRGRAAKVALYNAADRGWLRGDGSIGRQGRAYVRDLLRFLRRTGYR